MIVKQVQPDGTIHLFWMEKGRAHHFYKKIPSGTSYIFDSFGFPWNPRTYKDEELKKNRHLPS